MNDTGRALIMNAVTVLITLAVAFGVSLTSEQSAALTGAGAVVVNLIAFFWKAGQEPGGT